VEVPVLVKLREITYVGESVVEKVSETDIDEVKVALISYDSVVENDRDSEAEKVAVFVDVYVRVTDNVSVSRVIVLPTVKDSEWLGVGVLEYVLLSVHESVVDCVVVREALTW
jgi:hypothetical protein